MGHAPSGDPAQARVPGRHRLKKTLATARLRTGAGRECSLPACLSLASGADYDLLMGASGAAFTTTIDGGWDPLAASPLDDATLERGARAAGFAPDVVDPPFDDDLRALVLDRIGSSIDAGIPALIRGAIGPAEYGLLVGLDDAAPSFYVRTYFDPGDKAATIGWDAFKDREHGRLVFLDASQAPERATLVRQALALATGSARESDLALEAWLAGLRDEDRWKDARHGGAFAFADHAMRTILADKRRSAARFLRASREAVPARVGAEMLRAAEAYGHVAEAAERVGVGAFDPAVAVRFVGGGQRRAWANALEAALPHEALAHEALAAASMSL